MAYIYAPLAPNARIGMNRMQRSEAFTILTLFSGMLS